MVSNPYYQQWKNSDTKVDGEKYLNQAITQILDLPKDFLSDHAEIKVDSFLELRSILISQLESLAIATGKIKVSSPFVLEECSENDQDIRVKLREYFLKENIDFSIGADQKAISVLRFIKQGPYQTKTEEYETKLLQDIKDGKLTESEAKKLMDNFKFQLIVKVAVQTKAKKVDVDA